MSEQEKKTLASVVESLAKLDEVERVAVMSYAQGVMDGKKLAAEKKAEKEEKKGE
jgi:hypothetical protein